MTDITPSADVQAATSDLTGPKGAEALKAASNNSVSPVEAETPKTASASSGAKTTSKRKKSVASPKGQVVSGGKTDPVSVSLMSPSDKRKSLTVHHLQRRLADLGYSEAVSSLDGRFDKLTESALGKWQEDNGYDRGSITLEQARELFDGDPNVTVKP